MKNKKLKLENLKVQSFVTALDEKDKSTLQIQVGGKTGGLICSELAYNCPIPPQIILTDGGMLCINCSVDAGIC